MEQITILAKTEIRANDLDSVKLWVKLHMWQISIVKQTTLYHTNIYILVIFTTNKRTNFFSLLSLWLISNAINLFSLWMKLNRYNNNKKITNCVRYFEINLESIILLIN